jgi:hypothetical protein
MSTLVTPHHGRAARLYTVPMRQMWQGRVIQATARYSDHVPMATVCCNACRTCIQTNLTGLALGGLAAVGVGVRRFARRFVKPSQ